MRDIEAAGMRADAETGRAVAPNARGHGAHYRRGMPRSGGTRFALAKRIGGGVVCALVVALFVTSPRAQPQNAFGGFAPGLGDFMNLLIQPRHDKLGLAGEAKNWPLAGYALKELRESLASASKGRPKHRNLSVPDMIEATLSEPLKTLDAAIKAKDSEQFTDAYAKLTAGCNSCHMAANMGFVVIKVPTQSAFANQDFAPKR